MNKKLIRDRLLVCLFIFLLLIGFFYFVRYYLLNPFRDTVKSHELKNTVELNQTLTKEQAKEDLAYLVNTIKKHHVSAIHGLPEAIKVQYEYEISSMPMTPTVLELYQATSRITSLLKDGHSTITTYGLDYSYYLGQFNFEDTHLTLSLNQEELHITEINNVPIETIWSNYLTLASYENLIAADYQFETNLTSKEFLMLCNAASYNDTTVRLTYQNNEGAQSLEFPYITKSEYDVAPVSKNTFLDSDFVNYRMDYEHNLGILTLNECNNNELYQETLRNFFSSVNSHHVNNIVLDLRNNPGGQSSVLDEFISYLNTESYKCFGSTVRLGFYVSHHPNTLLTNKMQSNPYNGNVYVLTSNYTFSSAMMFSVTLQDNHLALVIGEPSSNKPSSYGDVLEFQLPNSNLLMSTTFKYFSRPDSSKDSDETQIPDYIVPSEDALSKVYELIQ